MTAGRDEGPTRLVLIRHGEARCNVEQVVGGFKGCTGLTERGRFQVEALRDRLVATGELADADVLLTSVLRRAVETAEILAPALRGLPVVTDCDLCELHPGEADGLPWANFEATYGTPDMRRDPDRPLSPGGESWTAFMTRVSRTLGRVAAEHAGATVVLACHGGIIGGSLITFLRLDGRHPWWGIGAPEHTGLTVWQLSDGAWELQRYNDAAHLAGLG